MRGGGGRGTLPFERGAQGGDMCPVGAAAAAEDSDARLQHRGDAGGEFLRRAVIDRTAVDNLGHPGVRLGEQRHARVFAQALQQGEHLRGASRAVQPEGAHTHTLQHGERGGHVRPRQRAARRVTGEGDKDRLVTHAAHGEYGCARVGERHHRLDGVEVDPGLLKPRGLFGVDVYQLLEARLAERGEKQPRRGDVACDPCAARRGLLREGGKAAVIFRRPVHDAALLELLAVGAEGRRIDDPAARVEIAALHLPDRLRVLKHPLLGAALARVAALLQLGAGCAVKNQGKTDFHQFIPPSVNSSNAMPAAKASAKSCCPESSA